MLPKMVLIRGAGDLASGVAHRLSRSGFKVVMTELSKPLVVRTTVSFAAAIFKKQVTVEGVTAVLCHDPEEIAALHAKNIIPVMIDAEASLINKLQPAVLVDAIMAKGNRLTKISEAGLVIGLGPGFTAGQDVHCIVETKRGHDLGKVIYSGQAALNTGVPGEIAGYGIERLLRAPAGGLFQPLKKIGELVQKGETVATVAGVPVTAATAGLVRGLLFEGLAVEKGLKVGDIDPRGLAIDYNTISEKARAVGGGVLEAVMHRFNI